MLGEEERTRSRASEQNLPVVSEWAEHIQHVHLCSDSKPEIKAEILGDVPLPAL